MTSNQTTKTPTSERQEEPTPAAGCCGVEFANAGGEGSACRPPAAMAEMAQRWSESPEAAAGCPMAKMCGGMVKGGPAALGWLMLIPATLLVALGAAILLAPEILAWIVAGGLIFAGALILVVASLLHRLGKRAV